MKALRGTSPRPRPSQRPRSSQARYPSSSAQHANSPPLASTRLATAPSRERRSTTSPASRHWPPRGSSRRPTEPSERRARRAVLRSARGLPPDSRGATWARWRPARRSPGTTGPPGPGWAAQEGEVSFLRCAPPRRSWPRCAGSPRTRASTSRRSAQGWSRTPARRSPGSPGGGSRLAGRILAGGYRTLTNISPTMTEA